MNNENNHLLQEIECNALAVLELTKEVEEIFGDDDTNSSCDNDHQDNLIRYDDVTLLVQALARNESIQCIRFEGDFLDCLHPLRRSEILRTLGSYLPNLHHLGLGDSPLSVADLCHLVTESKSLRSLHLHDSILQGSLDDFRALEEALTNHPTIQGIEIHECTSAIPGTNLKALRNAGKRRSSLTSMYKPRSPTMLYGKKRFDISQCNRHDFKTNS